MKIKKIAVPFALSMAVLGLVSCGTTKSSSSNDNGTSQTDECEVVFYTNGGTALANKKVSKGSKLEGIETTRNGYDFAGWFLDVSCTQSFDLSTPINGKVELYAKWNKKSDSSNPTDTTAKYTVVFNTNGGSAVSNQVVESGKTISSVTTTRSGYTFAGWYEDSTFQVAFSTASVITSNKTLYAKWTANAPENPIDNPPSSDPIPGPSAGEFENATGKVTFLSSAGDQESLYAEFEPVTNATGYAAYVSDNGSNWTKLDNELVRLYKDTKNYYRVDALGLKKGTYSIKVNPIIDGSEDASKGNVVSNINVVEYDRSGFAFSKSEYYNPSTEGLGAYKLDGTLKDDAVVLYVGADNAKTISCDMIVDSKGKKETRVGLQNIIQAFEKGCETRSFDFRIIGELTQACMDSFGSSNEGLQVKGKSSAQGAKNITIEGVGNDATIHGFGFLIRNSVGFEMRNLGVMTLIDDDISLDGGTNANAVNYNAWIHDNDLFYGPNGSGDHAKGDGALDIKGTFYATLSYNHYYDSGKATLHSNSDSIDVDYVSYHHNWFDHSDSRHPRVRCSQNVHVYNNYYDGNAKYGIGSAYGASIFSEANYFRNCKYPFLSGYMAHDKQTDGKYTMSGEKGGVIKSFGDYFDGTCTYTAYVAGSQDYDVYIAATRNELIGSEVFTPSGTPYSNFDTSNVMYTYTIQTPAAAKETAVTYAGRMGGGDFKWTFDNSKEDTNYAVIPELRSAIDNYKTKLVSIQRNK